MTISSYSIARALLKEKYALNAKTTQEALLDSRTCLRYFPGIPMGKVSTCLDFLRNVASVKNPKASHSVVNPEINQEELPGTWRHIQEYAEPPRAKSEPDVQDVYQLLSLDWITSIDTDAAKWTHAKWVKHEVSQQVGNTASDKEQVLHVIFRNVSPQHLGSIATALQAQTTFVNPVIFGETVTGTFSVYLVKPSTEPDGSGTVEILMGNSKFQVTTFGNLDTPREYEEINLYGVAKDLQVGIIAAWKALAVKGSYSYPRYDSANHTVDLTLRSRVAGTRFDKTGIISAWNDRYKTTEEVHFGLTETEVDTYVATKPPLGQDWKWTKRFDESMGTWSVFIEKTVQSEQTVPTYTSQDSAEAKVSTDEVIGTITPTTKLLIAEEAGKIKRRKVTKNANGSSDVSRDVNTGKEQIVTVKIVSPAGTTAITDKTFQATAIAAPTSAKGHIKKVTNKTSDFHAKFDTTDQDEVPTDQVATSHEENAFESETNIRHSENATALGEPTHEVGKIKTNQNLSTQAGNTKTDEKVRTAIPRQTKPGAVASSDTPIVIEIDENTKVEATRFYNQPTLPNAELVAKKNVSIQGWGLNGHELYDYTKVVRSTIPSSKWVWWDFYSTRSYWNFTRKSEINPLVYYLSSAWPMKSRYIQAFRYYESADEAIGGLRAGIHTTQVAGYPDFPGGYAGHTIREEHEIGPWMDSQEQYNLWDYLIIWRGVGRAIIDHREGTTWRASFSCQIDYGTGDAFMYEDNTPAP